MPSAYFAESGSLAWVAFVDPGCVRADIAVLGNGLPPCRLHFCFSWLAE